MQEELDHRGEPSSQVFSKHFCIYTPYPPNSYHFPHFKKMSMRMNPTALFQPTVPRTRTKRQEAKAYC